MNALDALAVGIVAVTFFIGFLRGFLKKALEMASFTAAAVAAYYFYKKGGSFLQVSLAFFITNAVLLIVLLWLNRILHKDKPRPAFYSRMAGGSIGALEGAVYAAVVVIFAHFAYGMFGGANSLLAKTVDDSYLYSLYQKYSQASKIPLVVEAYRMGEALKGKNEEVRLNPEVAKKLSDISAIKSVLEDEKLMQSILDKDYGKVISDPKIMGVLNDKELMKELLDSGLFNTTDILRKDVEAYPD